MFYICVSVFILAVVFMLWDFLHVCGETPDGVNVSKLLTHMIITVTLAFIPVITLMIYNCATSKSNCPTTSSSIYEASSCSSEANSYVLEVGGCSNSKCTCPDGQCNCVSCKSDSCKTCQRVGHNNYRIRGTHGPSVNGVMRMRINGHKGY